MSAAALPMPSTGAVDKALLGVLSFAALGVIAFVVYLSLKGLKGTTRGATDAAGNAAAGVILGIGDQVGLPDPSTKAAQAACQAAIAAGDTLKVSLYCPAPTFAKYLLAPKPKGAPAPRENVILPDDYVGDLPTTSDTDAGTSGGDAAVPLQLTPGAILP